MALLILAILCLTYVSAQGKSLRTLETFYSSRTQNEMILGIKVVKQNEFNFGGGEEDGEEPLVVDNVQNNPAPLVLTNKSLCNLNDQNLEP